MVFPPPFTMLELRSHTLQIDARSSDIVRGGGGLRKADYYVETYKRWFKFLKSLRIFFPGL